jgi:glycosyl transferase family 87
MRRTLLLVLSLAAVALAALPAAAQASTSGPPPDTAVPMFPVKSLTATPAGFLINPARALAIAKTSPKLLAIHRTHHPLHYIVEQMVRSHYEIFFYYHGKVVADQVVLPTGQLGPTYTGALIQGIYARGQYGGIFDSPWLLGSFTAMFLLPLLLLRGRSWLDRLDIAVVLAFFASYGLFDHTHLESAVWLFYPPLVYLLVRMLIRGLRPRPSRGRLDSRLPTAVLVVGLLALIGGRIYANLDPASVLDVATASALGAYKILHGHSIYYYSLGHPDTYGPIAYLAYVPFVAIWHGSWYYLPAARAAAIAFDLLTIAGLIAFGMRFRGGRDGRRLGLLLAWLWAACPFSLLGMVKSTNDGLVALLVVLIMLVLTSPIKRGILVGLGAASKFFPAVLLPLVAVGQGEQEEGTVRKVILACAITVGGAFAIFMPSGGLKELWQHTLGYQLTRTDVFSIWALHASLAPIKVVLELAAVGLSLLVAFRPRGRRTVAQVSALAATVIIAVQLPALHWFYLYIVWFLPLVLIAVLANDPPVTVEPAMPADPDELELTDEPVVLASVA